MNIKPLFIVVLLNSCAGDTWPSDSYVDLPKGSDNVAVTAALADCTAYVVPDQSSVHVAASNALSAMLLPEALAQQGLHVSDIGKPVKYVVAVTDGRNAFIRVAADSGQCGQYFRRDTEGNLQSAGPIMVNLP